MKLNQAVVAVVLVLVLGTTLSQGVALAEEANTETTPVETQPTEGEDKTDPGDGHPSTGDGDSGSEQKPEENQPSEDPVTPPTTEPSQPAAPVEQPGLAQDPGAGFGSGWNADDNYGTASNVANETSPVTTATSTPIANAAKVHSVSLAQSNFNTADEPAKAESAESANTPAGAADVQVPKTGDTAKTSSDHQGVNMLAVGLLAIAGVTVLAAGVVVALLNRAAKKREAELQD